jgi:predicted XRE-type DNA-binding protein
MRKGVVLDEDTVLEIHQLARAGTLSQREIARQFGIAQSHVSRIKHALTWQEALLEEVGEGRRR